jgi:RNA-binding protein 39
MTEAQRKAQEEDRKLNKEDYAIFVSQVHPKVNERDLFEFFSHVGRVDDIRLIRDPRTNKSKGLCYVEFYEKDCVGKAISLSGQLLGGYPISISVTPASQRLGGGAPVKSTLRLYIGQIPDSVRDEDLRPVFEAFGEIDFFDIQKGKGFGYVQYSNENDGRNAMEKLNGLKIAGKSIKVGMVDSGTDGSQAGELEETENGGLALNATGRLQLMQRLGRGAPMPGLAGILTGSAASLPAKKPVNRAPPPTIREQPSTCLVIKNMFDPKKETDPNFDQEIKSDVQEEGSKFGTIKHLFVDKDSAGCVYMRYKELEGSKKLIAAFNGRWFGGRQITAAYVPDTVYVLKFPAAKGK